MTSLASYQELLARKRVAFEPRGLSKVPALNDAMFPHQAHTTEFLLRAGCGAAFLDTGLGKSLVALEWGRVILEHTNRSVLMLAPLAVGPQHQREAEKFGIDARYVREQSEVTGKGIWITNYERIDRFDVDQFGAVILDESSIRVVALKTGRRYVGVELKRSYYEQAAKYLFEAEAERSMGSLFDHPITERATA